ncbi:unnamed protein product [Citrullus colocynthis]|uniref:Uncharacterized protein n=1 Tax=Citrullus colocynthis TaxID=252529 RepID=A0ABP0XQ75_9ROSI
MGRFNDETVKYKSITFMVWDVGVKTRECLCCEYSDGHNKVGVVHQLPVATFNTPSRQKFSIDIIAAICVA